MILTTLLLLSLMFVDGDVNTDDADDGDDDDHDGDVCIKRSRTSLPP